MKSKMSFADILAEERTALKKRMSAKVPEWDGLELSFPESINVEQCSSSATAAYKAAIALRLAGPGFSVADLTGGLGVDSWAFARSARKVLYNEMNPALLEAVKSNFNILGLDNVTFSCLEAGPGTLGRILGETRPDLIFLDPARRSADGRKVFLLEDCSPDILSMQQALEDASMHIMIKVSPMADITMLSRRLGGSLKEVHILEVSGECKELLLILGKGHEGGYSTTVAECGRGVAMTFGEKREACMIPAPCAEWLAGKWLFEPGSALMKSDRHLEACAGMFKLAPSTHLYVCGEPVAGLSPFGRFHLIREVHPLDKKALKSIGGKYPRCEVTARNIPMTSDGLRKKLMVRPGPDAHIYGITGLFADGGQQRLLLVV